jgi:pimeloyl-ACP methyl ester carboxylesterase
LAGLHGVPLIGERLSAPLIRLFRQATEQLGVRGDRPYTDLELVEHARTVGGLDFADLRRFAAAVTVPTLVMSAGDDRLVEPDVAFTLAAAMSKASLVTHHHRARGGHFLQRRAAGVIANWFVTLDGARCAR